LIEKAVHRLGMLGLLSALAHSLLHLAMQALLSVVPSSPAYAVALASAIVSGLVIYGLTLISKLQPQVMLEIGLIFEVIGALCIGLIDTSRAATGAYVELGPGGIAFWITLFILVVPNTLGKTAVAALTSALMGPVAMVAAAYSNTLPPPPARLLVINAIPNFMAAAVAIILSRFIYSLGTDVSKAREMGSYKLVELLGRGGMGEVWRAQHRLLARPAAVKLIQPEVLGAADSTGVTILRKRFELEAQATATLSSPHTVDLYDFGMTDDGAFYYVMELLQGIDLETLVERYGPIPAERAAFLLIQVCESLEEAHQNGLVHRDIKPSNIYTCRYGLDYDFSKVLDFGMVKAEEEPDAETRLTRAGTPAGTPGFMSPEMALGREIDARADIYAVGCVAYWLLTGRLVFEEETLLGTLMAHAQAVPVPPSKRTEIEIPPALEHLVMSCLEKLPERRPPSAGEIRRIVIELGLADSWTQERAEKWWKLHMPELTAAGTQTRVGERVHQSNVATI